MSQSLAQIYIHLIFSTKNRRALFQNDKIEKEMHAYLAAICNNIGCPAVLVGGFDDHVHILCSLSRLKTVSDLVRDVKSNSSGWLRSSVTGFHDFGWQSGYGAFSVSASQLPQLKEYIVNQRVHHAKMSFQDEFRTLLQKYAVEFNEQYVWD